MPGSFILLLCKKTQQMKKIIDYILSCIFLIYFGLVLLLFHAYQVFAFNLLGKKAHKKSVDQLNGFLTYGLCITGAGIKFEKRTVLPEKRPLILVANHQSTFDIPGIFWFLRKYNPVFVSKIELSKGIPSISYNLRKSGAALINRRDSKQAITEIARLGTLIKDRNIAAAIFPEGTRTASGVMKPFAPGGIATLLKRAPNALVVPIAIKGTGRLNPTRGIFPLTSFTKISWTVLPGIEPEGKKADEIATIAQQAIQLVLDEEKIL